ncbi:unnamed protein product [Amoebophrya sp. A120]|nr:unnamed protein product [Amoebophrya sp. A120]|eukprot:GSA120T00026132001.1
MCADDHNRAYSSTLTLVSCPLQEKHFFREPHKEIQIIWVIRLTSILTPEVIHP